MISISSALNAPISSSTRSTFSKSLTPNLSNSHFYQDVRSVGGLTKQLLEAPLIFSKLFKYLDKLIERRGWFDC